MKSTLIAILVAALLLSSTSSALACEASQVTAPFSNFAGQDLNDFAKILRSSQVNSCAQIAHDKLLFKLNSMTPSTWNTREWSGVPLSMALATGLVLGGSGYMSETLDNKLTEAANNYGLKMQPGCGFTASTWTNGNTCLEDHAISAAGQGWRAAWYRLTGREWTSERSATLTQSRNALSESVNCIHNPNRVPYLDPNRGVCNSTLAELEADTTGTIEMMTLNHGYQNPAYGIGQMTHVAAAYVGLEVAIEPVRRLDISTAARGFLKHLYREGNSKATPSGAFGQNCRQLIGTALTDPPATGCWDPQGGKTQANGYRADMFPVARWYDAYGYVRTLAPGQPTIWTFENFNASIFSDPNGQWGAGRYEAYFTMANQWLSAVGNKPPFHSRGVYKGGLKRSSYYVVNSGTGTPTATSTVRSSSVPEATLVIQDLNGGNLVHGDPVAIKNKDGFYWQPANGGGSTLSAPSQGIPPNAIFTILRIGIAAGPFGHNSTFALRTPNGVHYLTAPLGGVVSASATTFSTNETFKLERLKSD